jgi:hypothetical protein
MMFGGPQKGEHTRDDARINTDVISIFLFFFRSIVLKKCHNKCHTLNLVSILAGWGAR